MTHFKKIASLFILGLVLGACASHQTKKNQGPVVKVKNQDSGSLFFKEQKPYIPVTSEIMGKGISAPADMANLLKKSNPSLSRETARSLSEIYIQEASKEGVNHDIAFAQMCLETAFLKFGNQVKADQNNFCGLGALDGGAGGACFSSPEIGVRAHIQHLKAYASREELNEPRVDPRFKYVKRGSAPTLEGLAGKWASDRKYADKIRAILNRLYGN